MQIWPLYRNAVRLNRSLAVTTVTSLAKNLAQTVRPLTTANRRGGNGGVSQIETRSTYRRHGRFQKHKFSKVVWQAQELQQGLNGFRTEHFDSKQ